MNREKKIARDDVLLLARLGRALDMLTLLTENSARYDDIPRGIDDAATQRSAWSMALNSKGIYFCGLPTGR